MYYPLISGTFLGQVTRHQEGPEAKTHSSIINLEIRGLARTVSRV